MRSLRYRAVQLWLVTVVTLRSRREVARLRELSRRVEQSQPATSVARDSQAQRFSRSLARHSSFSRRASAFRLFLLVRRFPVSKMPSRGLLRIVG
jgi:hypothetical protein